MTLCLMLMSTLDFVSGFPASLACSLILTLLLGGLQVGSQSPDWFPDHCQCQYLQALVLPRTTILLLLFLTAFIWIAVILMLLLAVRLRWDYYKPGSVGSKSQTELTDWSSLNIWVRKMSFRALDKFGKDTKIVTPRARVGAKNEPLRSKTNLN